MLNLSKIFYKNHILVLKSSKILKLFPKYIIISLQVLTKGYISMNALEAVRKVIIRKIRGIGKLCICLKPYFWLTSKPNDVRMGKGKGDKDALILPVKVGCILFEVSGVSLEFMNIILKQVSLRLPVKVKFVKFL